MSDPIRHAIRKAHEAGGKQALDRALSALGRTLAAQLLPGFLTSPNVLKAFTPREHGPSNDADLNADPHQALLLAQLDHHIHCAESGENPTKGDRALHKLWDDPEALSHVLAMRMDGDDGAQYEKAAERAPKGGITLTNSEGVGTFYVGGQWIPSSVIEQATPAQKQELAERKSGARPNPLNKRETATAARIERQGGQAVLRKAVAEVASDLMLRPNDRTPDKYKALAQSLTAAADAGAMSVEDLRTLRIKLSASFGGGRRKDQMIAALLKHADEQGRFAQDEIDNPTPPEPPKPRKERQFVPKPETVDVVPTSSLSLDPNRFQFKMNVNAEGVTTALSKATGFKTKFAGVIAVWYEKETGKTWVVNGHHRFNLAKKFDHPKLAVYYIDAPDAKQARAEGALINIAEGRGTALDAAKFLKDSGRGPQDLYAAGISPDEPLVRDAVILTKLNPKAFHRLMIGELPMKTALAVASHLENEDRQEKLFKIIARGEKNGDKFTRRHMEEMARQMANAPSATVTNQTLWGDEVHEDDTFMERAELASHVRNELTKEKGDYKALASDRRAEATADAGNTLNTEENRKRAAAAGEHQALYDTIAHRKGAVSDILDAGAVKLKSAKTQKEKANVRAETESAVRAAIARIHSGEQLPTDGSGVGGSGTPGAAGTGGVAPAPAASSGGRVAAVGGGSGDGATGVTRQGDESKPSEDEFAAASKPFVPNVPPAAKPGEGAGGESLGKEASPAAPREPWQMTAGELETYKEQNPDFAAKYERKYPGNFVLQHMGYIQDAVKAGKPVPLHVRKEASIRVEPWEETQAERLDATRRAMAGGGQGRREGSYKRVDLGSEHRKDVIDRHREAVKAALATGKPVPPEVLADYPELAPKAAPSTEPVLDDANAKLNELAPHAIPREQLQKTHRNMMKYQDMQPHGYSVSHWLNPSDPKDQILEYNPQGPDIGRPRLTARTGEEIEAIHNALGIPVNPPREPRGPKTERPMRWMGHIDGPEGVPQSVLSTKQDNPGHLVYEEQPDGSFTFPHPADVATINKLGLPTSGTGTPELVKQVGALQAAGHEVSGVMGRGRREQKSELQRKRDALDSRHQPASVLDAKRKAAAPNAVDVKKLMARYQKPKRPRGFFAEGWENGDNLKNARGAADMVGSKWTGTMPAKEIVEGVKAKMLADHPDAVEPVAEAGNPVSPNETIDSPEQADSLGTKAPADPYKAAQRKHAEEVYAAAQRAFNNGDPVDVLTHTKRTRINPAARGNLRLNGNTIEMAQGGRWNAIIGREYAQLAHSVGAPPPPNPGDFASDEPSQPDDDRAPHEQTQAEYVDGATDPDIADARRKLHREEVELALKGVTAVPPEVLADYPDLKPADPDAELLAEIEQRDNEFRERMREPAAPTPSANTRVLNGDGIGRGGYPVKRPSSPNEPKPTSTGRPFLQVERDKIADDLRAKLNDAMAAHPAGAHGPTRNSIASGIGYLATGRDALGIKLTDDRYDGIKANVLKEIENLKAKAAPAGESINPRLGKPGGGENSHEQVPTPGKEPHEQTQADYIKNALENTEEWKNASVHSPHNLWAVRDAHTPRLKGEHEIAVAQAIDDGKTVPPEVLADYPRQTARAAARGRTAAPVNTKPDHEMTLAEFRKSGRVPPFDPNKHDMGVDRAILLHRNAINQAISAGVDVPAKVLEDYPDIARRLADARTSPLRESLKPTKLQPREPRSATDAADILDRIRNEVPNSDDPSELLPHVDAVGKWLATQKQSSSLVRKLSGEAHSLADKVTGGSGKGGNRIAIKPPSPVEQAVADAAAASINSTSPNVTGAAPTSSESDHGSDDIGLAGKRGAGDQPGLPTGQRVGAQTSGEPQAGAPGTGGAVGGESAALRTNPNRRRAGAVRQPDGAGNPAGSREGTGAERPARKPRQPRLKREEGGPPRDEDGTRLGGGLDGKEPAIPDPTPHERVVSEPPEPDNPTDVSAGNFRYTDREFFKGGKKTKFNANMAAIRTLREIQAEGRTHATPEEQAILSKFVGWGQFPAAFNEWGEHDGEKARDWEKERVALRSVLSDEEWEAARQSTQNSHYTHPDVIDAHWKLAQKLGFKGGKHLETSAGVGYYMGMMPPELAARTRVSAVEKDPTVAAIAKLLYPASNVTAGGFEDYPAIDNHYDLVASNVPFGNVKVYDPRYNKHQANIHDYFFLKSADLARPGGLVMHVTSAGTLDKPDSKIREELAKTHDLVGAIRFPGGSHKENAGTDVVTDMVVLRKRLPGEEPGDQSWLNTTTVPDPAGGEPIPVNQYFANNPHMILGTLDRTGSMYQGESANVSKTPDYEERLAKAIDAMPSNVMSSNRAPAKRFAPSVLPAAGTVKDGGFHVADGKLFVRDGGQMTEQKANPKTTAKIAGHITVRDALREVLNAETAGRDATEARAKLNEVYDAFVKQHGPLNAAANKKAFGTDPDGPAVLALEKYDPDTKKATKADIFVKPTVSHIGRVTHVNDPVEGVGVSLHENGHLDIDHVARLAGMSRAAVGEHLRRAGVAYEDPSEGWQESARYLSGNVRRKLALARAAAAGDPRFADNVAALEKVQPEDIHHEEIDAKLGAAWIPPSDVQRFAAELLGTHPDAVKVQRVPTTGEWLPAYGDHWTGKMLKNSDVTNKVWGTDRVNFMQLFDSALNGKPLTVWDTDSDGNKYINKDSTEAAHQKVQEIKDEFKNWLWTDDERRTRLHRHYNDNFNNIRNVQFDGSHQKFPGLNPSFRMRDLQKNFVWQVVSTGKGLAGHEVGTGKTASMVAAAMELRRLGLARKPAIACLKSNVDSITEEARHMYPGARILSTADMFDAAKRKQTIAKIATGDYDMVILTHDHLDLMGMKPETRQKYVREELAELEAAYQQAYEASGKKKTDAVVKQLGKARDNLQVRLQEAMAPEKKDAVHFEDTGIDHLFIDEAHQYKSLPVYTRMGQIKGIPNSRSNRATNMLMRTRWLAGQNGGRGVTFATGTPVTNTMVELYNMQRYLQPKEMEERGIHNFDAWASTFGDTETRMEKTLKGGYVPVTRFTRFTNIPELKNLSRQFLDVKLAKDLVNYQTFPTQAEAISHANKLYANHPSKLTDSPTAADLAKLEISVSPNESGDGFTVKAPSIVRPIKRDYVHAAEKSEQVTKLMNDLKARAQAIKGRAEKGSDNMLSITTDGRKGSIDMRMVYANAPDDPNSKTNAMVRNVLDIHKKNPGKTQMIFSDIGANAQKNGFELFTDIKKKLIAGGVKPEEFADFTKLDGADREEAIKKMRTGQIRIAIGGTKTLGTGVNAQTHLLALHHLDCPHRPSDLEQREGRGWRHGNKNKEVHIHRYVTQGSLDEMSWQGIARKARFIRQALSPDEKASRSAKEEDNEELTPEQVMAAAAGDPRILEKVQLDEDVRSLGNAKIRHEREQRDFASKVKDADIKRGEITKKINDVKETIKHLEANPTFRFTVPSQRWQEPDKHYTDRKEAAEAIEQRSVLGGYNKKIGEYRGLDVVKDAGRVWLVTKGGTKVSTAGTLASIEAVARQLHISQGAAEGQLAQHERDVAEVRKKLGKPFAKASDLEKKAARLKELNDELAKEFSTDDHQA